MNTPETMCPYFQMAWTTGVGTRLEPLPTHKMITATADVTTSRGLGSMITSVLATIRKLTPDSCPVPARLFPQADRVAVVAAVAEPLSITGTES